MEEFYVPIMLLSIKFYKSNFVVFDLEKQRVGIVAKSGKEIDEGKGKCPEETSTASCCSEASRVYEQDIEEIEGSSARELIVSASTALAMLGLSLIL